MDRRDFLKQTAAGVATIAMGGLASLANAAPPRNVTWFKRPHQVFKPYQVDITNVEYTTLYRMDNSLLVHLYTIDGQGHTKEEAKDNYLARLDAGTGSILLAAARSNKLFPFTAGSALYSKIFDHLAADNVGFVEWGGYIIGVNLDRRDCLRMPVRTPFTEFEDISLRYRGGPSFWAWSDHGLAILDNKVVVAGRTSNVVR